MFVKPKMWSMFIWQALFLFAIAVPVCAHEFQYADKTEVTPLRWKKKIISLAFSNSLRQSAANIKPNSDVVHALKRSLNTWERATGLKFLITWTDKQTINFEENADGINLITIAETPENIALFHNKERDATGRTRIFFNKNNFITEADIVINPYQPFSTDGSFGTFDLEATLTHEIGHLLGLNHSSALASTMYVQQGKNGTFGMPAISPRTLAEDDLTAVRFLYADRSEEKLCCGQISGFIQDANGIPLGHWQIWAEESETGRLIAVVSTKKNGTFQIGGLKPAKYQIFAQPFAENFNVEAIGEVTVEPDKIVNLQQQLTLRPKTSKTAIFGYNGQLSLLPIELSTRDNSHLIFFGGENLYFADFAAGKISVKSPFLIVDQTSLSIQNFDAALSIFSFEMQAHPGVANGEYNLEFQKQNGEISVSLGCFSIENQ
jgi:hypothetical protein